MLRITQDDENLILNHFNTNPDNIKRDVNILRQWLFQEPHLPHNVSDAFLKAFLIRNKCRVELTKLKIDSYFTLKGIHNYMFDFNDIIPSQYSTICMPFKNLHFGERICLLKIMTIDPEKYSTMHLCKILNALGEMSMDDYCTGFRLILDYTNYTMSHTKNINLRWLATIHKILEAKSCRVNSIDLIYSSSFYGIFIGAVRALFKPKILNKIHHYKDVNSFCQTFPRELLPKDYGGNNVPIKIYLDELDIIFEKKRVFLQDNKNQVTNEKLRMEKSIYSDLLIGLNGTFKQIEID